MKILKISKLKRGRVVDINVKKNSTFITRNGIITHNCDRLSSNAQNSLNQIIEDVQHITRFFFICNNPNKMSDPLLSRCAYQIDLNDPPAKDIFAHLLNVLKKENVIVKDKSSVVDIIKKLYPDIRQMIGVLQSNVIDGNINRISFNTMTDIYQKVFDYMLNSDIENVRKILKGYVDYDELYEFCYKQIMDDPDLVKLPAEFILITGEHLYRNSTVSIKEINFIHYVFSLMKSEVI